jgi:Protein of unknown function (DUF974)
MLQLPTGTELMLGETLTCYVRLINLADAALTNIAVKASCHRRHGLKVSMLRTACAWSVLCPSDGVGGCGLQCELKTDRQRLMLHDTSSKPLKRLAASEGYDFLLRHDVKEPNDHVLTFRCAMLLHMHLSVCVMCATWPDVEDATSRYVPCSATYTAGDGSARTEQQTVLFSAQNPLSVRTKVSLAGSVCIYLKMCYHVQPKSIRK